MKKHHEELVYHLQALCAEAGGPISLPALLRLATPRIERLLGNGVRWSWLGARVLAVHIDPEAEIPADLAKLSAEDVRTLVAEFSRQKRRKVKGTRNARSQQAAMDPGPLNEARTEKATQQPEQLARRPVLKSRSSIHAAADLNSSIGKLKS